MLPFTLKSELKNKIRQYYLRLDQIDKQLFKSYEIPDEIDELNLMINNIELMLKNDLCSRLLIIYNKLCLTTNEIIEHQKKIKNMTLEEAELEFYRMVLCYNATQNVLCFNILYSKSIDELEDIIKLKVK
jgi:hypothetical protein